MKISTLLLVVVALVSGTNLFASTNSVDGVWQTERGESGGYLHVNFSACGDAICGVIIAAYNAQDQQGTDYPHLGKKMVWGMTANGDAKWAGGKIWDPVKDKKYKSKMTLKTDVLEVSGCVAFICRSQEWRRVK